MSTIDKNQLSNNFSMGAATYDAHALVQKTMAETLIKKLRQTGRSFHSILEIGCGTGLLSAGLAELFPEADISAVDIAPAMIEAATARLKNHSRLRFIHADGEILNNSLLQQHGAPPNYDLITSSASFQWFNDCDAAFRLYHSLLQDYGILSFNTFGSGSFPELRAALASLRDYKPGMISLHDAASLHSMLESAGFQHIHTETRLYTQHHPTARDLILNFKRIGAHAKQAAASSLGRDIFKLCTALNASYKDTQGVRSTYEVLYVSCTKQQR